MRPPSPPVNLGSLLATLDGALAQLMPDFDLGLRPPSLDTANLPPELQLLYQWHDGQEPHRARLLDGLGSVAHRTRYKGRFLPLAEARAAQPLLPAHLAHALPVFETTYNSDIRYFIAYEPQMGALVRSTGEAGETRFAEAPASDGSRGVRAWVEAILGIHQRVCGPFSPEEAAQRWVLAVRGILGMISEADFSALGYARRPLRAGGSAMMLRRDWDIFTPGHLRECLNRFLLGEKREIGPDEKVEIRDADVIQNPAWHWARASNLALSGYGCFFLDENQAWPIMVEAARQVRGAYRSWEELGRAYLAGRNAGKAEAEAEWKDQERPGQMVSFSGDAEKALDRLLHDPRSPWRLLPWELDLGEGDTAPPPPREIDRDVFRVSNVAELDHALANAMAGDRVVLAPGTYQGTFITNADGVEIDGQAGVVLESAGDEPVFSSYFSVVLRDLELRGKVNAVGFNGSFARFERCTFRAGADGIGVVGEADDHREIQLVDCHFLECGDSALWAQSGYVHAQRIHVERPAKFGLRLVQHALGLTVEGGRIVGAGTSGVSVAATAVPVILRELAVEGAAKAGVRLDKGALGLLWRCDLSRNGGALFAAGGARVLATECKLRDSQGANVELTDTGPVVRFVSCEITGGAWGGVWLHPGDQAWFRSCTIEGSRLAGVYASGPGEGIPTLLDCRVGASKEGGAIYLDEGARLQIADSSLGPTPIVAVEVKGGELTLARSRIHGAAEGLLAHGGATVRLANVEIAEIVDVAARIAGATALLHQVRFAGCRKGLVVGHGARATARLLGFSGITATGTEDEERGIAILVGEAAELTLLGGVAIGGSDDSIQLISGARLWAEGLNVVGTGAIGLLAAGDAAAFLRGGSLTAGKLPAVVAKERALLVLDGVTIGAEAAAIRALSGARVALSVATPVDVADGARAGTDFAEMPEWLAQGAARIAEGHQRLDAWLAPPE